MEIAETLTHVGSNYLKGRSKAPSQALVGNFIFATPLV
jgi:hypothetical protein